MRLRRFMAGLLSLVALGFDRLLEHSRRPTTLRKPAGGPPGRLRDRLESRRRRRRRAVRHRHRESRSAQDCHPGEVGRDLARTVGERLRRLPRAVRVHLADDPAVRHRHRPARSQRPGMGGQGRSLQGARRPAPARSAVIGPGRVQQPVSRSTGPGRSSARSRSRPTGSLEGETPSSNSRSWPRSGSRCSFETDTDTNTNTRKPDARLISKRAPGTIQPRPVGFWSGGSHFIGNG